jgi:hypothetical protein
MFLMTFDQVCSIEHFLNERQFYFICIINIRQLCVVVP